MKTLEIKRPLALASEMEARDPKLAYQIANEGETDIVLPDSGGGYKNGDIYFANDSRFIEDYFSQPLTAYAVGWQDPNDIEATVNFLAPSVQVGRRFEWKKDANVEEFYSDAREDIRAIGSDFKRIEYTRQDKTGRTLNKGLTFIVDLDNVSGMPNWEQARTAKLLRRIYRNELRRLRTLITAAATNTAKTWDTTAGKDPDQDVETELDLGADDSGIYPNRILYGKTAWVKRRLSLRAQTNAAGFGNASLTPDEVAAYLGLDGAKVSRERYQSTPTAKAQVVQNLVWMFYAQDGVDTQDPTNFKRFVSSFDADQGGGLVRVFRQQLSGKLVAISVEMYTDVVTTSTQGIRQFTVS